MLWPWTEHYPARAMRDLLLTLHILAAAAWIGGGLFASVSFSKLATEMGLGPVQELGESVGAKFFGTAVGVMVLSGAGLVMLSETFGWGSVFVLVGIAVVVLDSVLEGAVFGPRLKRIADSDGGNVDEFRRTIAWNSASHLALFALAVWAMVVKLGL